MGRFSLFKRQRPASAPARPPQAIRPELPDYIHSDIAAATLFKREADDDGPRIACQFEGCNAFIYSDETVLARATKLWPELDADQAKQAVRILRARVRSHIHQTNRLLAPRRSTWATRY